MSFFSSTTPRDWLEELLADDLFCVKCDVKPYRLAWTTDKYYVRVISK